MATIIYRIKILDTDPPHIVEVIVGFNESIEDEEDFHALLEHVNNIREDWQRSQAQLAEIKRRQYGRPI